MKETQDRLLQDLKALWNDKDFIIGVASDVWESKEKMMKVIDYLEHGENVTTDQVILLSLELSMEGK